MCCKAPSMFSGIIVVTPDPRVAAAAARRGAAEVVDDRRQLLESRLRAGVRSAATRAARALPSLLPCDLATLTAEGLERLVGDSCGCAERRVARSVSCAARMEPERTWFWRSPPARFSRRSARQLFEAFGRLGAGAHELREPTVSFDIDTPEDLEAFARQSMTVPRAVRWRHCCAEPHRRRARKP